MNDAMLVAFEEHARLLERVRGELTGSIEDAATRMVACLQAGNAVFWCGNGGSASDAEHLAAELVGRFKRERPALHSAALSANTSLVTAIGNDYGFDDVFRRQVEGVVRRGDVLVGLSTSGNSENVMRAMQAAKQQNAVTIGLLGRDGGKMAGLCDLSVIVPGLDTARIQEMHILIGHILCDSVEQVFSESS